MAEVTGMTSTRMLAIEAASVVDGAIDGSGHLILTTHGGTDIDAGSALPALPTATTSVQGIVELATNAETITGTDTVRAVTPAGFAAAFASAIAAAILDNLSDVVITSVTINDIMQYDGSHWINKQSVNLQSASSTDDAMRAKVTGDTFDRLLIQKDGSHHIGSGALARDVHLSRSAANVLTLDGEMRLSTLGKGFSVAEGSNARMGTAVLVAGTKVVSTTAVTANSRIFITTNTPGGTPGWLQVSARSAGTSFTILSSSATDTSTVAWIIFEPA